MRRSGWLRLADVVAFHLYYRLTRAAADRAWERQTLDRMSAGLPTAGPTVLETDDPNSARVAELLHAVGADLAIARCKWLLKRSIFDIPTYGTYVLHPGICPQYRNSHGCFWAIAQGDLENVGMTLLRIDDGIDTGPIFGFYRCNFDPVQESHVRIQTRLLLENLPAVRSRLLDLAAGTAVALPADSSQSAVWGQPWLSAYLGWRMKTLRGPR